MGQTSCAFASGLHKMVLANDLGPHVILGLLSSISEKWFVSDFACTLAGLPLVVMHRATQETALAHILEQTDMSVLIASMHVQEVVMGAARLAPSRLKVVIWIEDSEVTSVPMFFLWYVVAFQEVHPRKPI